MKKLIFLSATAALMMTSCLKEDFGGAEGDKATVSFGLALDNGVQTRNGGETTTPPAADQLYYAVFDENKVLIDQEGFSKAMKTVTAYPTSVDLTLTKGQTYTVAFWAQDGDSPYTVHDGLKIDMNYKDKLNNDATRDAFFGISTITVGESGNNHEVELHRPFAQFNVGATAADIEAAAKTGIVIENSAVTVSGIPQMFDVLTGEATDPVDVSYGLAPIPGGTIKVNEVEYSYLSMAYLLIDDKTTSTVTMTFDPADDSKSDIVITQGLSNIPFQRNWRTNIVGTFLTGNVHFDVKLDEAFANDANNILANEVSAADLQDRLDAINPEDDFVEYILSVTGEAKGEYTLPALKEGQTLKLIIAKASERATFNSETFKGVLDVTGNSEIPMPITIYVPQGDATLRGGKWTGVVVTTKPNTFTIAGDAIIEDVVIGGGNVKVYDGADVENISKAEGNNEETVIILLDGAEIGPGKEVESIGNGITTTEAQTSGPVYLASKDLYYATVAQAVAAAGNGDVIQLMEDVEESAAISIPEGKDVTFELNGNVLSVYRIDLGDASDVVFRNGKIIRGSGLMSEAMISINATLTDGFALLLDNMILVDDISGFGVIFIQPGEYINNELTLIDSSVECTNSGSYGTILVGAKTKVTIENSDVVYTAADDAFALWMTNYPGSVVSVKNSEILGCILCSEPSVLSVENSTVVSDRLSAITASDSEVTVANSTVECKAAAQSEDGTEGYAIALVKYDENDTKYDGYLAAEGNTYKIAAENGESIYTFDSAATEKYVVVLPTEAQWAESNVWHAYVDGVAVAEISKELIRSGSTFYQAVVVNTMNGERANIKNGFIAQVLKASNGAAENLAGGHTTTLPLNEYTYSNKGGTRTAVIGNEANFNAVAMMGTSIKGYNGADEADAEIVPYLVKDGDQNEYPVVRYGCTYWLRENLRTTSFNDGTPLVARTEAVDVAGETGPTRLYHDQATYAFSQVYDKTDANLKKYGYLYNFRAMAGAPAGEVKVYAGETTWDVLGSGEVAMIAQKGETGIADADCNKQLCPEGWHVPTANGTTREMSDVDYLDGVLAVWHWQYHIESNTGLELAQTANNWSGLSFNLQPAYEQGLDTFEMTTTANAATINDAGQLVGCVPFWNTDLVKKNDGLLYPVVVGLKEDGDGVWWNYYTNYVYGWAEQAGAMSYPVRCVRNHNHN